MKAIASCLLFLVTSVAQAMLYVNAGQASFGADPIKGASAAPVTGVLVFGGIGDAPDASWAGKVVLLDRGTLTYTAKVSNAQGVGAVAVVIVNNTAAPFAFPNPNLGSSSSPLTALSVNLFDRAALLALVGSSVTVAATSPPAPVAVDPLPDQTNHEGDVLTSHAGKAVWAKLLVVGAAGSGTVKQGAAAMLAVQSDGLPAPSFQWLKDGTAIAGATSPTFVLASAAPTDAGVYTCTATNDSGSSSSGPYNLTVTP